MKLLSFFCLLLAIPGGKSMSEQASAGEPPPKPITEFDIANDGEIKMAVGKLERKKRREKRRARHTVRAWQLQQKDLGALS